MTHNIQFFSLLNQLIKHNNQTDDWCSKTIFSFENCTAIKDGTIDYLTKAELYLDEDHFDVQTSGIYLRKEFKSICKEFDQLSVIGKKEKPQNIINTIKNKRATVQNNTIRTMNSSTI